MTDRDALYRAILANPGDDTPRLVYADWLQENDRPEEAEFIRADCRLEAAAPDAPEFTDLLDRREELRLWLTAHAPGPRLTFPHLLQAAGGPSWWVQTYRGFPRYLEFERYQRAGLKPMRELAAALGEAFRTLPTRWLVLRFVTVEQLAELLKQPVVAGLEQLGVQLSVSDAPQDEAARVVANCPHLRNLRGLYLWFSVGEAGADALARCGNLAGLQVLRVNSDLLTPVAIRSLARADWFRGLRQVHLDDGLPDAAFAELCRCGPFPNLHTLDVADNAFAVSTWQAFARSEAFPALTAIDLTRGDLTRGDLTDGRCAALAGATGFRLAALDLTACSIGNDGAAALAAAPWAGTLRRLNLRHNNLGPAGVAALGNCPHFTRLRHLDLGYSRLGSRGLRAVATNPALRGLTRLQLYGDHEHNRGLTAEHFERFLTKLDMPNLRHLDLSGRPVGLAARALTAEKFASLRRLELADCNLTNGVVSKLLTAPALQHLVELNLLRNNLRKGVEPLTDRGNLPRLSRCVVSGRNLPADLARRLKRRPGVYV